MKCVCVYMKDFLELFSQFIIFFFKLFQRCLMTVLNLDLWKCYISYVKETKSNLRTFRCTSHNV